MTCAEIMQAAAALLGLAPQPGTVVNVPAAYVARVSADELYRFKSCARRNGIRWRIVDGR